LQHLVTKSYVLEKQKIFQHMKLLIIGLNIFLFPQVLVKFEISLFLKFLTNLVLHL